MTRIRASRHLGRIVALFLFPLITPTFIFTFFVTGTSNAEKFVSVASTPCPKPPPLAKGSIQHARGTIKSVSGQTLQITPKTSDTPINATYSSTTHITEQAPVTTPPASVLLKGVKVEIQAQNTNGSFTATSITLDQADDGGGCFPRPDRPNGPDNKATPPPLGQPSSPPPDGPRHDHDCFAPAGLASPTSSDKQTTCRAMGTVEQLQGNTLTITDRKNTSHTITLTSGTNATKIIKTAPADPSALKTGTNVTVTGPANQGVITAFDITIDTP